MIELLILCVIGGLAYRHREKFLSRPAASGRRYEEERAWAPRDEQPRREPVYQDVREERPRSHSISPQSSTIALWALLTALGLSLIGGLLFVRTTTEVRSNAAFRIESRAIEQASVDLAPKKISIVQGEAVPVVDASAKKPSADVPSWTQQPEVVVQAGQIPDVLLVRKSKLCSTEAEAKREAGALAAVALSQRLITAYPHMAAQPIDEATFRQHAVRNEFIEKKLHDFKTFEDTMYVAYVQFEDSPRVREGLVMTWERAAVDQRIGKYALGAGIVAAGLGLISTVLRLISARSSNRSNAVEA